MALTLSNIKAQDVHTSKQSFMVRKSQLHKYKGPQFTSVHVVPLHFTKTNGVEVLLVRFPSDHEHWPDMWYVPGYMLPDSEDPEDRQKIHDRVFSHMVRGLAVTMPPTKTEVALHYTVRGKEIGHVHYAEVFGMPHSGAFFDMRDLPAEIPEHYLTFIKRAANAYRAIYS